MPALLNGNSTDYGRTFRHSLAPCGPCGMWHCAACPCPSKDSGDNPPQ